MPLKSLFTLRNVAVAAAVGGVALGAAHLLRSGCCCRASSSAESAEAGLRESAAARELKLLSLPEDIVREYTITNETINAIAEQFVADMQLSLDRHNGSSLRMLVTYVDQVATGHESGSYYALDLGGTNYRVLRVLLGDDRHHITECVSSKYQIPDSCMSGSSDELFGSLAGSIKDFVIHCEGADADLSVPRKLAFTFSFPTLQSSLSSGTLIKWTKGFRTSGVEGKNVVSLLEEALAKLNVNVRVVALCNDTVGTMMTGCYKYHSCQMGLILGTGTNACYIEDIKSVGKWEDKSSKSGLMVINIEWGNFDSNRRVLPFTAEDNLLDQNSPNRGQQLFEKMISGMYLGEILRLLLLRLFERGCLFSQCKHNEVVASRLFCEKDSLSTEEMASFEGESTVASIQHYFERKFDLKVSTVDASIVRSAANLVSVRAARLSAAGIIGVFRKRHPYPAIETLRELGFKSASAVPPRPTCSYTVAVDGSVFNKYPGFHSALHLAIFDVLGDLSDPEKGDEGVLLRSVEDGSGIGAALVAAAMDHSD